MGFPLLQLVDALFLSRPLHSKASVQSSGFSFFDVVGGTSSLSLLMPNLIAATLFFHSEVLFVDAIFERTA